MPRTKNTVAARAKRKKILKAAKGYRGGRGVLYRTARETVERAMVFAYRDRRRKKRDFRKLWIARINAAARLHDIGYGRLMDGLRKAGVAMDRRILADLAANDEAAFGEIVNKAKQALEKAYGSA